jgi:hypothetical protein
MITFATLGPAGTNHEFVTQRYIGLHEIDDARIELVRALTRLDTERPSAACGIQFSNRAALSPFSVVSLFCPYFFG